MKQFTQFLILSVLVLFAVTSCDKYKYETVPNDPTATRIYTLDNGLKVYMSVSKDEPRIEAYVAVKVGGKNDPKETTGLAHYFEHLMFKGTEQFGTQNFEQEKPLLDAIEAQFEVYRKTTDEEQRKAIYKVIDSLSYEASKIAIPNEYDKLMAAIGSNITNAYTSYDQTVYLENVPSNELENWAKIQADRFGHNIIRGFHTELETVYEEKNMSLTQDSRKVLEATLNSLFAKHPYGQQTVLGTQEHLKNPSITNIKNYYKEWYVPNNMAVCIAGDFNPDEAIQIIDKYFSALKPNPNLKKLQFEKEEPITAPIVRDVYGLESPSITLAWRFPGMNDANANKMLLLGEVLNNGKAGLLDLNVNQKQKVLSSWSGNYTFADYSAFMMQGRPKDGQTLEQVQEILLNEINNLKSGNFDEQLLKSIVNNYKLMVIRQMESIYGRADSFVSSFIYDVPWSYYVNMVNDLSTITKADIVAYANEMFKDNNYAVIRKLEGKDPNEMKISKPAITPIFTNRDTSSAFLREIQNTKVTPIEPVFVDFQKDMSILKAKSEIPVLYKQNTSNELFELTYLFELGTFEDKTLGNAVKYLDYLGTSTMTPEQVKQAFYALACNFRVSSGNEKTYVVLSGLGENMKEAIKLFETLLSDAQANPEALKELKADMLQQRKNAKLNQSNNFSKLRTFATYGPEYVTATTLTDKELLSMTDTDLLAKIHNLNSFEHKIMYYGPEAGESIVTIINELHNTPEKLTPIVSNDKFKELIVKENSIIIAPYDAKQIYLFSTSNRGEKYDPAKAPIIAMFNEYFGGGMNSIVFQEMREARGLAYSAQAYLTSPSKLDENYSFFSFIATQNDKMMDALNAFDEIINNIPQSEVSFNIAKESLLTNLRTSRTIKSSVLWSYLSAKDLGLDYDIDKVIFEKVQGYTLSDVINFQKEWIKDRTYTTSILGDANDLDLKSLEKYGKITKVKTQDIFGY